MPKTAPDIPANVPNSDTEGFELLGIGVGKPSFCNRVLHKRVLKIKEALAKLDIIDDPQIELTLLRCCMGFRLRHPLHPAGHGVGSHRLLRPDYGRNR